MTKRIQMDFSLPWIRDIFHGLERAMSDILNRNKDEEWFDADFVNEHLEELLGLAFVLAQTYINRTWADLGKAGVPRFDKRKWDLMTTHGSKVTDHPEVSVIDLAYALADYWKHSDDWPNWNASGKQKHTVIALLKVGIDTNTDYPCVRGMHMITPSIEKFFDILLVTLESWRASVVDYHNAEGFLERHDESPQQHGEV